MFETGSYFCSPDFAQTLSKPLKCGITGVSHHVPCHLGHLINIQILGSAQELLNQVIILMRYTNCSGRSHEPGFVIISTTSPRFHLDLVSVLAAPLIPPGKRGSCSDGACQACSWELESRSLTKYLQGHTASSRQGRESHWVHGCRQLAIM